MKRSKTRDVTALTKIYKYIFPRNRTNNQTDKLRIVNHFFVTAALRVKGFCKLYFNTKMTLRDRN